LSVNNLRTALNAVRSADRILDRTKALARNLNDAVGDHQRRETDLGRLMSAALKVVIDVLQSRGEHEAVKMAIQRAVAPHVAELDLDCKPRRAVALKGGPINRIIAADDTRLSNEPIRPSNEGASAVGPTGSSTSV
jgi:hypothetical protein